MPKKIKQYRGNVPKSDGWVRFDLGEINHADWILFTRKNDYNEWVNVQVSANGSAERKANYHMGWNGSRWAHGRDVETMREHRPKLLRTVEATLCEKKEAGEI